MLSSLILLPLASTVAWSADVTDVAPWLRGDVVIDYAYSSEKARLLEGDDLVATRQITDSLLTIGGNFSVAPGAALYFALPYYTGTHISYDGAQQMVIDPSSNSGTMLDTATLDPQPEIFGKGMGGPWIGARGTPFSSSLFADRGDKVTWLLDVGYRFQDKTSLWTSNGTDHGAGPGSAAFRMSTAFSTRIKITEPYLGMSYTRTVPLRTIDNTGLQGEQIVQTASEANLLAGAEVVAYEEPSSGTRMAFDFHANLNMRTWQDIPSGIYLPSVLEASTSLVATEAEHASITGGIGLKYRVMEWAQLELGGDMGTIMPYQVEHFYPVTTGMGTMVWDVHTRLTLRGRDQPQRFPWDPK